MRPHPPNLVPRNGPLLFFVAIALFTVLLLVYQSSLAGSANLSATAPSEVAATGAPVAPTCANASTNCPTSLVAIRFEHGTCASTTPPTFGVKAGEVSVPNTTPAARVTTVISSLPARPTCFRAIAVNAKAEESAPSSAAMKLVVDELKVSEVTAYKQTQAVNGYTMNPIGTIALGTPCVAGKTIDGYHLLPDRNAVTMANRRAIRPTSAYAKCALQ